ncbi:MAG: STAS domain-containing protein [Piscirickettsiaceae bacterium]|nr:STAS domain-containing protein [Piscirickettsiaceae bacterium]
MSEEKTVVIDCGDSLNISGVGDLYAKLLTALAEGLVITLNVSKIERIDAAALQMLYAFSKEAAEHGNPIDWSDASDAFCRGAQLLGLAPKMNIEDNKA